MVRRTTATSRPKARPIPVDKSFLQNFVQTSLVPDIEKWAENQPDYRQNTPIGQVDHIAGDSLFVKTSDGRKVLPVSVFVAARPSKAKYAMVLGGRCSSATGVITLFINGAFSPKELIEPERMQSLWDCTHETCLPYSLYSILLHEVTHSSDIFKKKLTYSPSEVEGKTGDPATLRQYVNDPSEVKAFMQQVVDETCNSAKKELIRNYAEQKTNPNRELVDLTLKMSTTWSLIEKALNRKNKALILKAVHDAFDQKGLLW